MKAFSYRQKGNVRKKKANPHQQNKKIKKLISLEELIIIVFECHLGQECRLCTGQ